MTGQAVQVLNRGLAISAAVATLTIPAVAQPVVRGTVVGPGGVPVAGAMVSLSRVRDSVRASESGEFVLNRARAGEDDLEVRALGYLPKAIRVQVTADSGWRGTIVMDRVPQPLPSVEVVAKPPEFANTTKYDDFFRRRTMGQGVFRTRDEILEKGGSDIVSILQGIPGVFASLTFTELNETELRLRITRCPGNPPPMAIYIDGMRMPGKPRNGVDLAEMLTTIPLARILFVEFYRGVGQIPSDIERGDNCAALLIWLR